MSGVSGTQYEVHARTVAEPLSSPRSLALSVSASAPTVGCGPWTFSDNGLEVRNSAAPPELLLLAFPCQLLSASLAADRCVCATTGGAGRPGARPASSAAADVRSGL